jgi:tetratricopeptide (TPR) repeat protein
VSKNKFKRIALTMLLCAPAIFCPALNAYVGGRIESMDTAANLCVELRQLGGGTVMQREMVAGDGTFRFKDLPNGSYEIRVVAALTDETLVSEYVEMNALRGDIVLRIPRVRKTRPVSGVVSVRELQSHVPKKAFQAFVKAQQYAESDKAGEAIGQLRRAVAIDPGWRDAHVNLGVQLVRTGHYDEAVAELQEAIRIGPPAAIVYTNYAAALASAHRLAESEAAVREAIRLDPSFRRAHYLLGHMMAAQPGRDDEALAHLRMGAPEAPAAYVVAAHVLLRKGDRKAAIAELQAYLKTGDLTQREKAEQVLAELQP